MAHRDVTANDTNREDLVMMILHDRVDCIRRA